MYVFLCPPFSSTINPILYNVMSHRYRVAFRETLCGRRRGFGTGFARDQSSFRETTVDVNVGCENSKLVSLAALFRLGEGVRFEGFSWNDDASLFFVEKTRRSLISHSIVDWDTKVVMERRTFRAEEEWAVKLWFIDDCFCLSRFLFKWQFPVKWMNEEFLIFFIFAMRNQDETSLFHIWLHTILQADHNKSACVGILENLYTVQTQRPWNNFTSNIWITK